MTMNDSTVLLNEAALLHDVPPKSLHRGQVGAIATTEFRKVPRQEKIMSSADQPQVDAPQPLEEGYQPDANGPVDLSELTPPQGGSAIELPQPSSEADQSK